MQWGIEIVPGAIDRPRLAALFEQRWSHYVVNVVAGAGFGKSTAIAQATRARAADRHDHVVQCDASCQAESELVRRVAAAFGVPDGDLDSVVRAATALDGEHCLILDDVHRIDDDSEGAAALANLVDRMLPAVRFVVASRRSPPLRLARWRAAGQVLDIDQAELVFDPDELGAFAAHRGVDADTLATAGGWPALTALSALAGRPGAIEYVAEEVLDQLEPKLAEALQIAVLAGTVPDGMLERVGGTDVDPARLARAVPMLTTDASGALTPHDLWIDIVEPRILPERRRDLLARIATFHRERGDHRGALRAATRANDPFALAEVVRDIGQLGHIALDLDEIEHWVARAPEAFAATVEGRLLLAIAARSRDLFADETVELLATAWQELRDAGVVGCEVVALAELAFVRRARGEPEEMLPMVARLLELDAAGHPECRPFATFARAGIAEQLGDAGGALAELESLREGDLSRGWMALVEFQRCNHLLLLGRPREALEAARRATALGSGGYLGGWLAELCASWYLATSNDVLTRTPVADELAHSSQIERIWAGTWFGVIQGSCGRLDRAARNIATARAALRTRSQPEFVGFLAWAEAVYAVAEHDIDRARSKLVEFLADHPLDTPIGLRLAARSPALFALLLDDDVSRTLREGLAGAWQQAALDVAEALVALRSGRLPDALPEPAIVLSAVPLPWAVELAVLAARLSNPWGSALARHLTDTCGEAVAPELTALAAEPQIADLFGSAPARGEAVVTVLGEVGIRAPGITGIGELRRRKVRELLAMIALDGPIHREVLAERLWPGLDAERSANNLRVTLAYLRRVRADDQPLLTERSRCLALAPTFETDHARFQRFVREAESARSVGASQAALDLYLRALALVGGAALEGTADGAGFDEVATRINLGIASVGVRAAELASDLRAHDRAATAARIAVVADPYREDAHRLLVAALVAQGDLPAAELAAAEATARLAELGIDPDPDTTEVLDRARADLRAAR